jgi:hypothetical protein
MPLALCELNNDLSVIAEYCGLAIAQAAKTLEMTIHPLKTGGIGDWNNACETLPSNLPTQALKGTFVTDAKVTCFQDHINAHQLYLVFSIQVIAAI